MKFVLFLPWVFALAGCDGGFKGLGGGGADQASVSDPVTPLISTTPPGVNPNCHIQLQATNTPIKVIFLVDTSGSNWTNGDTIPGSDPGKNLRGKSIENFLKDYGGNGMIKWTFATFGGSSSYMIVLHSDRTATQAAVGTFFQISDAGQTPYLAALNSAQAAIANDPDKGADDKYVVIFMSDGQPNPVVADAVLDAKIDEITALKPGAVTVNGIYYGTADPVAAGRIQAMATRGGGKFLDLGGMGPNTFQIASTIKVPGTACQ